MEKTKRNIDAAAWLAVLLEAQQKRNPIVEARARRELARIGVKVSCGRGDKGTSNA